MKAKFYLASLFISITFFVNGQRQYNIVWLVAEDQSSQFFPMYGDTTIALPALESLASESIIYDNAFATVPVCAPARSSIILGMYPIATATHNMRTYNSYRPEGEPTINVPSYSPVMPPGVMEFPKYLRAAGYYCTNNAKEDYNMRITDGTWDASSQEAHWENKTEGQPFFSIYNFHESHESGIWRYGDDSLFVNPNEVSVPPYFPEDPAIRHDLAVNYSNLLRIDRKIGHIIDQLKKEDLYDDTYIFFYGDHGGPLPRHKRSLKETGLKVPLFVKLPKALSKGSVRSQEMLSFVDLAPTVLSIAGIETPENMHGRAFLGQFAGGERDYIFASSDRFDAVYDRSRSVRSERWKLILNYRTDVPYALPVEYREQMSMMQRWRALSEAGELSGAPALWMRAEKDPIEFYDLYTDPFELNNLANNSFYQQEIKEHRRVLEDWMAKHQDYGAIDEQVLMKKWKKMSSEIKLKAPQEVIKGQQVSFINPNEYGHLIVSKSEGKWEPYDQSVKLSKDVKLKVVHIGLDDSPIVSVQ
ncbi:sulfatase family protein [Portibacter marinus]|uniref:sulfatase family protein n=1 Tax=Portibacter marinus TaxID=2898660 RepID=UPI001F368893|nr:sulfatase [Portibacter marinus]